MTRSWFVMLAAVLLVACAPFAGCFRNLDFAPCQEDPSQAICSDSASVDTSNALDSTLENDSVSDTPDTSIPSDSITPETTESSTDAAAETTAEAGCAVGDSRCVGAVLEHCSGGTFAPEKTCDTACSPKGCLKAIGACAGSLHSCVLLDDATMRCFGDNTYGQLGIGSIASSALPTAVDLPKPATGLACGARHTCALLADKTIRCWGQNTFGQLGVGTTIHSVEPVEVSLPNVVAIGAGVGHTCALLGSGALKCWGDNSSGQLGDGTTTNHLAPTSTKPVDPLQTIALGGAHTCAITTLKDFYCWGNNSKGQLGDGTTTNRSSPTKLASAFGGGDVAIGSGSLHSCYSGFESDGCWGDNHAGQIGDGTKVDRLTPKEYMFAFPFARYALGKAFTCGLGDQVYCWGENTYGALGDGSTTSRLVPTAAATETAGATTVAAGDDHVLAIGADGAVLGWGSNSAGQLGGTVPGMAKSPTRLAL